MLFDQSSFAKYLLQGRDAEKVLQHLCANDVAVAPGRVVYTQMLNSRGGIEADLTVTRLADAVSLDALSVADWDLDVADEPARVDHDDDQSDHEPDEIDADLDAAIRALDPLDPLDPLDDPDQLIDDHAQETV